MLEFKKGVRDVMLYWQYRSLASRIAFIDLRATRWRGNHFSPMVNFVSHGRCLGVGEDYEVVPGEYVRCVSVLSCDVIGFPRFAKFFLPP